MGAQVSPGVSAVPPSDGSITPRSVGRSRSRWRFRATTAPGGSAGAGPEPPECGFTDVSRLEVALLRRRARRRGRKLPGRCWSRKVASEPPQVRGSSSSPFACSPRRCRVLGRERCLPACASTGAPVARRAKRWSSRACGQQTRDAAVRGRLRVRAHRPKVRPTSGRATERPRWLCPPENTTATSVSRTSRRVRMAAVRRVVVAGRRATAGQGRRARSGARPGSPPAPRGRQPVGAHGQSATPAPGSRFSEVLGRERLQPRLVGFRQKAIPAHALLADARPAGRRRSRTARRPARRPVGVGIVAEALLDEPAEHQPQRAVALLEPDRAAQRSSFSSRPGRCRG